MQLFELADELKSSILEMRLYEKNYFLNRKEFSIEENLTSSNRLVLTLKREKDTLIAAFGGDNYTNFVQYIGDYATLMARLRQNSCDRGGCVKLQEQVRGNGRSLLNLADQLVTGERREIHRLIRKMTPLPIIGLLLPVLLLGFFVYMIGSSKAMLEVFRLIDKVASLDCNVLVCGESGTGKEMVARAPHQRGSRRDRPFISFNCGGFTEELITNELFGHEKGAFTGATGTKVGLLEAADKGTIFLDEISEMPLSMQVKLLRFVQERSFLRVGGIKPISVDVRLIAASNWDLKGLVEAGDFRKDLYYRLNVVNIPLPPLRARSDDIPLLIRHFIEKYSKAFGKATEGVCPEALEILAHYPFPGNVRELENIIERAVALTDHN